MRGAALLLAAALAAAPAGAAVTALDPVAAADAFAPALVATPDGAAATWIEPAAAGESAVRFARFAAGAWQAPVTVVASKALFANWADTPGVARAGDGAFVVWWLERLGGETYAYGIRVARSTDDGATWQPLGWLQDDTTPAEHGFVSMVAEGSGLRAFWLDGRGAADHGGHGGEHGGGPMTLRTTTIGASVAAPSTLVDAMVCDCCATAAVAGAEGALVVYRDRTPEEIRDIRVARFPAAATPPGAPVAADGWKIAGCPVNGPAIARAGEAVGVAWFTGEGDRARVRAAFSADGGASFAAPLEIDAAAPLGRVGLAPLPEGALALAWLGRAGERAEVRVRRVAPAGAAAAARVLGTTAAGRRSGFPRLAALPGGDLLALWVEVGAGPSRLRAARFAPADLPE